MKRKHKTYSKPKRPFDKVRIDEEKEIKKNFGLKNKREIWKSDAKIKSIREKAKKLISAGKEEQEALFNRLKKIGLKVNSIADILGLDKKDYLERRLQTIVAKKFSMTQKGARQLITHKKVLINNKTIDIPSAIITVEAEEKITLKEKKLKKKPKKELEKNTEESKEEKNE